MGGYTRPNDIFLSLSLGKMTNTNAGLSYDGYEGTLVSIKRKTGNFEGNPTEKIEVHMIDSNGEGARISFGAETFYALGFFSRLRYVDVQKPFLLGVWKSKKNEKINLCYIKQEGETVKAPKEGEEGAFPQPPKVKIAGRTMYDYTSIAPIFDEIIQEKNALCPMESDLRKDSTPKDEPSGPRSDAPHPAEEHIEPLPF